MKKTTRIFGILLIAAMMLGLLAMTASAAPATKQYDVNGDGTKENAYEIKTADDLLWFAQQVNGGNKGIHGVLMNDIDLSTVCSETLGNWTPIGNHSVPFEGYFDGRGFAVRNLYINDEGASYVGLFGETTKNSLIRNVTVTGTIRANQVIGGIVGKGGGTVRNCVNYANLHATARDVGGIVGAGSGHIYGCVNYGNISADTYYAGGIIGFGYNNTVQDCLNVGKISGRHSYGLGHMNQESCNLSNFLNLGSADTDGVSDKGVTNCYSVSNTSVSGATQIASGDACVTSGELAFLLGGTWGQEIGKDATPIPGGMKVYKTMDPATLCTDTEITYMYANSENTKKSHDTNMPAETYENGFCPNCDDYQPAVLNGDTYEISNAGQLYWFAQHVNSGNQYANGRLTANITVNTNVLTATGDLNGDPASFRAWTPINEFRGSFHGDGYVISGLYAKAYGVGFISRGVNVKVYNLGVMDSYFENTGYASGAIVGYMASNGTMENCFSNATIAGSSYISGGLVGEANHYAAVRNCYYFGKTVGGAFAYSGFSWYDSKSGNNYYVSTVDDGCEFTTAISPDILATGELAYLLNGSVNGGAAWGQVIGTDAYPIPVAGGNEKVYRTTLCNGDQGYANAEKITEHDPSVTAADRFNKAGQCLVCGTQAVATVTTAGNVTTYYVDIDAAAAYAAAQDHSTMILLTDVDLGTGKGLFEDIRNKVNVTLDLNGKTLSSENSHTINWNIYGHQEAHVTLTINDSVGTGKVINRKFNAVTTSTHLTINGGYFEAGIGQNTQAFAVSSSSNGLSYKDTVIINGGTFHSNNGISSSSLTYMVINGGTFTGVTSVIHSAYEGQFVINGGNFPEGITTRVEWSEPIAKLLAHGVFLRDENGAIVTLTETQSKVSGVVTASKGANLETDGAAVTANTSSYPYTNLEHKPTATVVIGGQTLIEGQDYTLSWSNNVNIGTSAVVTATGIGDFSGSAFGTFEITKGSLKVVTNPETTYEFGDVATDKAVTGGKVVIVGNESAVIPGTWAWIVPGETAQFTPDAQYIDLFEALTEAMTVTHVVTPASPVIEVVTPSPSIMPGMAIRMGVVVKNPYNGELTDLPTAFRVTYKIGENGTPVTVSGLEFTLPTTGVALGDKVYVTVENVAVSGKYAVAVSTNTIELAVGQVDYTAAINELEEQIAALKAEHGADVSELEAALEALRQQLAALNDTYATDEELAAAVQTINNTISELTNRITTLENTYATKAALEEAIKALNEAIAAGDATSAEALAAAVENLEQKLAAAVAALEKAYQDADTALKTALEALIADTKTALETAIAALEDRMTAAEGNITQLQADLAAAIAELETAIATNSGDIDALEAAVAALEQALSDAIDELKGLISAAETAAKAYADEQDAALRTALETMINEARTTLEAAIAALDARVTKNEADIAALQADLTKAIEDLTKAIADGDAANAKALEEAVAQLTRLLNEAVAKLEQADAENKAALEKMINQARAALEEAIAQLRADLEQAVEDLENADKANAEALAEAVKNLTAAIEAAEAAAAAEDAAIRSELAAAKASLQSAIVTLRNELYSIRSELLTLMTDKDAVLDGKIADLAATLEAAVAVLEAADEAVKAELTAAIDAAKSALTAAIEQVAADLAATRLLLNTSMAAGDKALHNRINELTAALEAAIAAAEAADADLSAELEAAVATLNAAIDQMQQALNQAKTELTAKDVALDAKDAQLQQLVTVAIVIASVGVAGCVALVIYITVDKRKKV